MAFPVTLDDLDPTRGSASDPLSSPSHATHHQNEDTLIEALQAKVGIDSSAVSTSLDYQVNNSLSISPGHLHVAADISDLTPISSSTGVADSGKLVKLNASGLLDASFTYRQPTIQVYSASDTWTKPTGLTYAIIEVVGAGGGGGDGTGTSSTDNGGAGGGGGGYAKKIADASSLGATETVTIGAGGTGTTTTGTTGGDSTFTVTGGSTVTGGGGAGGARGSSIGGGGGTASNGDLNISGRPGDGGYEGASGNGGHGGATALGSLGAGGYGGSGDSNGGTGAAGAIIVTEYYN